MGSCKFKGFKIFGERHTGTNAITSFLERNFNLERKEYEYLGWKHRLVPDLKEMSKNKIESNIFVITLRNPYSWFHAMHRNPYSNRDPSMKELKFTDFLEYPFEDYENLIVMWNKKTKAYIEFINNFSNAVAIKIEVFNHNQERFYKKLLNEFELNKVSNNFVKEERYLGGDGEKLKYNINKSLIVPDYSARELSIINKYIDKNILNDAGYLDLDIKK